MSSQGLILLQQPVGVWSFAKLGSWQGTTSLTSQHLLQKYAGASIAGAVKLNQCANDVVINWSGGLHHAKKSEVSQSGIA